MQLGIGARVRRLRQGHFPHHDFHGRLWSSTQRRFGRRRSPSIGSRTARVSSATWPAPSRGRRSGRGPARQQQHTSRRNSATSLHKATIWRAAGPIEAPDATSRAPCHGQILRRESLHACRGPSLPGTGLFFRILPRG